MTRKKVNKLDLFIERGGSDCILMASSQAIEDFKINAQSKLTQKDGLLYYSDRKVEEHDEWSWGWMVRRADGSYVSGDDI